ncbi:MAG: hypothetical protein AAB372_01705 [Patescibacteria group bacterium]
MHTLRKKISATLPILIIISCFFASSVSAQEIASTTPQVFTPQDLTVEQQLIIRKQILDLFGIPTDAQISLFDTIKGNPFGNSLPGKLDPLRDVEIVVGDEALQPGTRGSLYVVAANTNLRQSTITWSRNNKIEASGKGATVFSFPVGAIGSRDIIKVTIRTPEGSVKQLTKTINPARIHFAWSTDSYTPTWYRGKALPVPGSGISVTAFPEVRVNNIPVPQANLDYEWSVNDEVRLREQRGASTFSFLTSEFQRTPYQISVRVRDSQRNVVHRETILIKTVSPFIRFYREDALYGLMTNASIQNLVLKPGDDSLIDFEPYHMPYGALDNMAFRWDFGSNQGQQTGINDRKLRITTPSDGLSSWSLSISYSTPSHVLLRGKSDLLTISNQSL